MRINDQDIARAAQELRDEENQQLHVRPWSRQRHFRLPTWLAAVPAAAVAGFLLGIWTNSHTEDVLPLTALTDTVYVTVKEPAARADTMQASGNKAPLPAAKTVRRSKSSRQGSKAETGKPVMSDKIRYDLLVMN